jgi:quinol monooxygenase YgiN
MSTPVSWHLNMTVRDGKLEELRTLIGEMVESTEAEPGTTDYEWFLSEDGKSCHLYERYQDSEAAMIHLGNFGSKFAERFMGCLEMNAIHVYGALSDELRAAHEEFGAVFLGSFGGFRR